VVEMDGVSFGRIETEKRARKINNGRKTTS
jgi:hypothetical protein